MLRTVLRSIGSLIEERGRATSFELFQGIAIIFGNLAWVFASFQRFDGFLIEQKLIDLVDLEGLREELIEGRSNFEAQFRRVEQIAARHKKFDTFAELPVKGIRAAGSELHRDEAYAGDMARIQIGRCRSRIHPRSAHPLKWRVCSTPDAEVRALQNSDARVKDRLCEVTEVGRRINPELSCRIEPVRSLPSAHLHDGEM